MSLEDSIGSRAAAREQQSLFSRYQDDASAKESGSFRVEVGADGRSTDVELELPDPESEDGADGITAPYDPSKIEIQSSNPTINLLMSRLSNGMIDLAPDFQRRAGIWSDEQQSRLIESLLLRIPIPSFYAAELDDSSWAQDSSWAIVDGIQRLTAIARFIAPQALAEVAGIDAGPLKLRGLEYLRDDFEGKGYNDLTGRLQIRLNETQVVVHVIRPGTPEAVKFNIFARINTGGLPLTRQEIRHALIPGPARQLLSSLAESPEFISATSNGVYSERMADREMVLRTLAFRLTPPASFKAQDFDQFLALTMRQINRLSPEERDAHARDFKWAMFTAEAIFDGHAFRKLYPGQVRRSPVNKAIFETVAVNLAELSNAERGALVASREKVVEGFQLLMTDRDFERAVSVGTGDRAKVVSRFARVRELFRTILESDGGQLAVINQVSLTNFKAFRSADIRLAPVTLLTGLNSSGKSTVLQSLALLRQSHDSGTLLSTDGDSDESGGLLLNGDLVELGTGQDLLHEDFVRDETEPGPLITVRLRTDGWRQYAWSAGYAPEQDVLPLARVLDPWGPDFWAEAPLFSNRFQYLKADRIVPATSYPRSHHQAIGRGFLGSRGEHTVNFLRHHAQDIVPEGPLRHPEARAHTFQDQVVAWMQELCPGVNLEATGIPGTDSVQLSYGFGGTAGLDSSSRRRPTNVGFGLTYALPIVVACLTAAPESLILLENPEAHLHPRGQARMAALIAAAAAAGAQLIVETHSDHVLDGTRLAVKQGRLKASDTAIHYFRGNGAGVEIVTPVVGEDGTLSEWPEGFFDETDHTLDQLLD